MLLVRDEKQEHIRSSLSASRAEKKTPFIFVNLTPLCARNKHASSRTAFKEYSCQDYLNSIWHSTARLGTIFCSCKVLPQGPSLSCLGAFACETYGACRFLPTLRLAPRLQQTICLKGKLIGLIDFALLPPTAGLDGHALVSATIHPCWIQAVAVQIR